MMGLEILAKPGPIPREMILKLKCDGDHGFLPRFDTFEGPDFMAMRSAATLLGWKESFVTSIVKTRDGPKATVARVFLCPECAAKSSTARGEPPHDE